MIGSRCTGTEKRLVYTSEFLSFRSIRRQGGNANFVETKSKISPNLLHCRLGHPSMKRVKAMSESENYDGLHLTKKIMKDDLDCKCVSCLVGKSKSLPHKRFNKTKEYDLGELIHLDFKPLTPGSSLDGKDTGFFACVEAASGLCRLYECNSKAEQLECFMDFHKFVERQLNTKVKAVRHDRGSEYLNHKFMSYLKSYGIVDQTTASYSHESAKIETFIRLLDMIAKTIMAHAQVPKMYLKRAYFFAAYLYNRVPGPNGNSPYQLFTGTKPRVDHLRVPFCKVVYHLPKETRKKGDIPGKVGRFIGYSKNSDTYTVWNGDKVIITRDVKFMENHFNCNYTTSRQRGESENEYAWLPLCDDADDTAKLPPVADSTTDQDAEPANEPVRESSPEREDVRDTTFESARSNESQDENDAESDQETMPASVLGNLGTSLGNYWNTPDQPRRRAHFTETGSEAPIPRVIAEAAHTDSCFFTAYFGNEQHREAQEANDVTARLEAASHAETLNVPRSYSEAMSSPERTGWRLAMDKELKSLEDYNVFTVIGYNELPPGIKVIDSTWIFAKKLSENGEAEKKARLCARGDKEEGDFTIEEIFAGVIRSENVKLLFALICSLKWPMVVIDVKTAFLNAPLNKPVYLKIPRGAPFDRGKQLWKLNKALYGLRKAPRAWNDDLTGNLTRSGYQRCELDWNLFVKEGSNGRPTAYVAFHVDDGLLTASSNDVLRQVIGMLRENYEIKENWNPKRYLGINFDYQQDKGLIYLDQRDYIRECALKYRVDDMRPFTTPMDSGFVTSWVESDTPLENQPYRGIIGVLSHIARQTRPDILFAFSALSKNLNAPSVRHWNAAKRVLAYLYHTKDYTLCLGKGKAGISCYSDATWADDLENRRSRSGGVVMFGNCPILCWSKQQQTVALSSCEAEYQAAAYATQNIKYFRNLLVELKSFNQGKVTLYLDNKAAMDLTVSTKHHSRLKHIDIRFHFVREAYQSQVIDLSYVRTQDQIADIFTKPLAISQFVKFRQLLQIEDRRGITPSVGGYELSRSERDNGG